ncbi:MAG: hypothetical protein M0P12_06585 [Paludibacteraceae bacterium]|nr:hypothetical protein [Paludibacteraceae bacterium]
MIKINKQLEPQEWTRYRCTKGARYKSIPELRKSLLEEQGYICAYCMRRIPVKDSNSNEDSRIEHLLCRVQHPESELCYNNMVICCPGAINDNFHCDKKKGDNDISFNLFDNKLISTISYGSKNGEIKSSNQQYNREIKQILNLNNKLLSKNRLETLNAIINFLKKKNDWNSYNLNNLIIKWNTKDKDGQFKPYCGIVIWFLEKKLKTTQ